MLNKVPGGGGTRLDQAKTALNQVLADMGQETRVQIWTFNTRMQEIRVRGVGQGLFIPIGVGSNRQALMEQVKNLRTAGGTNLYASIVKSLKLFSVRADQRFYQSGERFPVLVVLSDGEDLGKTRETLETVLETRKQYPLVTINTIGFQIQRDQAWYKVLCKIATQPGGCATANDARALEAMLDSFYRPGQ